MSSAALSAEAHFAKTGTRVFVDWRTAGGTSEIARYVAAQYLGSFRNYWTRTLHREWTPDCAAFDDPKATTPEATAARKAFLTSDAGCGVDLFFGGGSFDYMQMAAPGGWWIMGWSSSSGAVRTIAGAAVRLRYGFRIPASWAASRFGTRKGAGSGFAWEHSVFVIIADSLARLGIAQPPAQWLRPGEPAFCRRTCAGRPTQSGSVAKAFEMIIQQQIARRRRKRGARLAEGMQLIQRISANARFFTDSGTEIPFSVEAGDAAAGMCIDFYGRFESEAVGGGWYLAARLCYSHRRFIDGGRFHWAFPGRAAPRSGS